MPKWPAFLTGALGAFAPQILRWYSQSSFTIEVDPVQLAGSITITLLFLILAGFVTVIWEARSLKEAFLVGLGVPSIILSAGPDVTSLLKAKGVHAQVITTEAHLVVAAKTAPGQDIAAITVTATDEAGKIVYFGSKSEALLPPGRYTISVSASGYESETKSVALASQQTVRLNVTLRRKSFVDRFIQGIQRPFEQRPP